MESLLHTPLWIPTLILILLYLGWKARFPRIMPLYRVYLVPSIFSLLSIYVLYHRYQPNAHYLETWIGSFLIGIIIGWLSYRGILLAADKEHALIRLPASHITLVLILLFFAIRYLFFYLHTVYSSLFKQQIFIYADLFATALIIGFFFGKALQITYAYCRASHSDLY